MEKIEVGTRIVTVCRLGIYPRGMDGMVLYVYEDGEAFEVRLYGVGKLTVLPYQIDIR